MKYLNLKLEGFINPLLHIVELDFNPILY